MTYAWLRLKPEEVLGLHRLYVGNFRELDDEIEGFKHFHEVLGLVELGRFSPSILELRLFEPDESFPVFLSYMADTNEPFMHITTFNKDYYVRFAEGDTYNGERADLVHIILREQGIDYHACTDAKFKGRNHLPKTSLETRSKVLIKTVFGIDRTPDKKS